MTMQGSLETVATQNGSSRSPIEIIRLARIHEVSLSRLLMAYISSGTVFMLLPGTFLGVWNLLQISGHRSTVSVSPAWIQAHGHAQIFGWIGSFILGIGFYSLPKQGNFPKTQFGWAWACWAAWTIGVAVRWLGNIYQWHWRLLLPASAVLELAAFLVFFMAVSRHRPGTAAKHLEPWIVVVISASIGFLAVLVVNLGAVFSLAQYAPDPALPHVFDQRYLNLTMWGFLVPFLWGFSSKWMPIFLGLKPVRWRLLFAALVMNFGGIILTFMGWEYGATALFAAGVALAIAALRMLEPAQQEAKTRGIHGSFPYFVRVAYIWLLVAAVLGVCAALWDTSGGIWGASRHALTVGFVAVMALCVGQRVLPAFAGMRLLWSTPLMFAGLALLAVGCALRVPGEILAYQHYAAWAWSVLPVSAVLELAGIAAFAANIFGTFLIEPSHVRNG